MRKFKIIILTFLLSIVISVSFATTTTSIDIVLDGHTLNFDVPPQLFENRTIVPFRAILEALNADVMWQEAERKVVAKKDDVTLELTIDESTAYINGTPVSLDVTAKIIDGRTLVPIRFISESLKANVNWDKTNKTVYITTPAYKPSQQPLDLGTTLNDLISKRGQPQRTTLSEYGFYWYTYHHDYRDFSMIGIRNGRIVAIYSMVPEKFVNLKIVKGDTADNIKINYPSQLKSIVKGNTIYNYEDAGIYFTNYGEHYLRIFMDTQNNNQVTAIFAVEKSEETHLNGYYGSVSNVVKRDFEWQLFDLVNAERAERDLTRYIWAEDAVKVARAHSQDMIDRNFFAHINPSGIAPHERIKNAGIDYYVTSENIACGHPSAIFAHENLMNSAGHRKAILSGASHMTAGVEFGGNFKRYYTEIFYTPK